MPYIKQRDRKRFDAFLNTLDGKDGSPHNPGELNYLLTQLCLHYLSLDSEHYAYYNDVIGALECAKMEIYRRRLANFEDIKIKENGDL